MLKFAHYALAGALFIAVGPASAQAPSTPGSLTAPALGRVLGPPGVRREAGNWLFNDSIFVAPGQNVGVPGAPAFVANLRRDKKEKLPLFRGVATRGPLNWSTLPLPSLREMSIPGYNFATLQASLTAQVSAASSQGRIYIGWSLPVGDSSGIPLTKTQVTPLLTQLRTLLTAVAPDSALILEVDATQNPLRSVADIDAAASSCDAILLHLNPADPHEIWPLKMARRNVEEQKDFDLPIFVALDSNPNAAPISPDRSLEFYMGGATGFIAADAPTWSNAVARNPGLFTSAVTIEDAAILPSQNPVTLKMFDALRAARRIPLVGRQADGDNRGESLLAVLDDQTSLDTLSALDRAARGGAAIYLEGLPDLKNKAILDKLIDMTSSNIEVLATPRSDMLNLSDPWLFGDARGREFEVTQRVKWTLKTSLADQANTRKGMDVAAPLAAAKLATDPNGLLMAPLGKGRIVWLAHPPLAASDAASLRPYYSAIAGNLQGGLVDWKFASVEDEVRNGGKIHAALRASKLGTPIMALWNDAATDANITLEARGGAPLGFDLMTEKEFPATVNGYSSYLKVTVPARSYIWLTYGKTRRDLDKERLTARPKARIMK